MSIVYDKRTNKYKMCFKSKAYPFKVTGSLSRMVAFDDKNNFTTVLNVKNLIAIDEKQDFNQNIAFATSQEQRQKYKLAKRKIVLNSQENSLFRQPENSHLYEHDNLKVVKKYRKLLHKTNAQDAVKQLN